MDKTTYIVYDSDDREISKHREELRAVAIAGKHAYATVDMIVESGTYRSRTRIYPTHGNTYSN